MKGKSCLRFGQLVLSYYCTKLPRPEDTHTRVGFKYWRCTPGFHLPSSPPSWSRMECGAQLESKTNDRTEPWTSCGCREQHAPSRASRVALRAPLTPTERLSLRVSSVICCHSQQFHRHEILSLVGGKNTMNARTHPHTYAHTHVPTHTNIFLHIFSLIRKLER